MRVTHNYTLCNASRLTTVDPTSKQLPTKLSAAPVRQSDHGANLSSETAITLMSRRDDHGTNDHAQAQSRAYVREEFRRGSPREET
jgi:hypothetical protein